MTVFFGDGISCVNRKLIYFHPHEKRWYQRKKPNRSWGLRLYRLYNKLNWFSEKNLFLKYVTL